MTSKSGLDRSFSHTFTPDVKDTCRSDVFPPNNTYTLVFSPGFSKTRDAPSREGIEDRKRAGTPSRLQALASTPLRTDPCDMPACAACRNRKLVCSMPLATLTSANTGSKTASFEESFAFAPRSFFFVHDTAGWSRGM